MAVPVTCPPLATSDESAGWSVSVTVPETDHALEDGHPLRVPVIENGPDSTVELWATSGGTQARHPSRIMILISNPYKL